MFDPNTVTPSPEILRVWCYENHGPLQDKLRLAAQWGATQAAKALRYQWPEPIADRRPTEEDGDDTGQVQYRTYGKWKFSNWRCVADSFEDWLHTPNWRPKPEPTPREHALALLDSKDFRYDFSAEQIQLIRKVVESAPDSELK